MSNQSINQKMISMTKVTNPDCNDDTAVVVYAINYVNQTIIQQILHHLTIIIY